MKFKKLIGAAVAAGLVALAIAGPIAPATAATKYTVGLVTFDMTNTTTVNIVAGMKAQAKKLGWAAPVVIDSTANPDKMNSAIQTLVQKKVSVIFTQVFPSFLLSSGLAAAKAANIPVASIGGGTGDGVQTAWDDGVGPGVASGKAAVAASGGVGELLKLGFTPGTPCRNREKGFDSAVATAEFNVTRNEIQFPGQVEISNQFTAAWLAAHAAGSAKKFTVWACTDDAAIGASAAVAASGRTDVKIITIDGTPAAMRAVKAGTIAAASWIDGYGVGQSAIKAIASIVKRGVNASPKVYPAPYSVVTKKTLTAFLKKHPKALG